MITLYSAPAGSGFVVHWMLLELEATFKVQWINMEAGEHKQPAYLAINPNGLLPSLMIDDKPMGETAAILMHLTDYFPEKGFARPLGTPERAAYYYWMVYIANALQPAFRNRFFPHEPGGEDCADAVKAHSAARIAEIWQRMDTHLAANGPYLLGDKVSTPDFLTTLLMRWSRNFSGAAIATSWPALAKLAGLMKQRPAFKEAYKREGITDWT
jgi:glutathione S-transferase